MNRLGERVSTGRESRETAPGTRDSSVSERFDVVVIGAGPAGSVAARQIAARGCCVLLVDRAVFPRPKVCGCCLGAAALAALRDVGLDHLPRALGAPFYDAIRLHHDKRTATLSLPRGVCISRAKLDAALVEAATRAGVVFRDNTAAKLLPARSDFREVEMTHGEIKTVVQTKVVVVADGLGGRLLDDEPGMGATVSRQSRIGIGATCPGEMHDVYQSGIVHMAGNRCGYVGLARTEGHALNIAAAVDVAAMREHHGAAGIVTAILQSCGLPVPTELADLHWQGTPHLTRRRASAAGTRLFAVGDCAGYVEPFTGEGMTWAINAAISVAPFVIRGVEQWRPELARRWHLQSRQLHHRQRIMCRMLAHILRRPALSGGALWLLQRWPELAQPVIGRINRAAQPSIDVAIGGQG